MATATITVTEFAQAVCADCGERPGTHDLTITSPSAAVDAIDTDPVMVGVCLVCIANLAGQLGGAVFAVAQDQLADVEKRVEP